MEQQIEYRSKSNFLQVKNEVIDDTNYFDKFEKWVWIVLARHGFSGLSYPSQKTIAKKVGISDRKVRDCLKSLEEKGWLIKAGINETTQTIKWIVTVPEEIEIRWMEDELKRRKEKGQVNQPKIDQPKQPDEPKEAIPYKEIIDHLNEKAGKKFKHTSSATRKSINGRWNEGNDLEAFKHVIDVKTQEWKGTEWEKHLCPETLFRPSNFEKYLNQKPKPSKQLEFKKTQPDPQPQKTFNSEDFEAERIALLKEVGIES